MRKRLGYSFYIIKDFKVQQIRKTIEAEPGKESDEVDKEYNGALKLIDKQRR
jgi:hypothetical protein